MWHKGNKMSAITAYQILTFQIQPLVLKYDDILIKTTWTFLKFLQCKTFDLHISLLSITQSQYEQQLSHSLGSCLSLKFLWNLLCPASLWHWSFINFQRRAFALGISTKYLHRLRWFQSIDVHADIELAYTWRFISTSHLSLISEKWLQRVLIDALAQEKFNTR